MAITTSLKERVRAREPLRIAPMPITATRDQIEELINREPFEMLYLNCQHTPLCERELLNFCQIAEEFDKPVQLRIKHPNQAYLLGNYLDLGPLSIKLPTVEKEATVVEALESFYFPPLGKRSWGGWVGYGVKTRKDRQEYSQWWNQNGILCLQLESVEAIVNCRKLAKSGVDWIGFGPQDLTFDLEQHSHQPFEAVEECVHFVVEQLKELPVCVYDGFDNRNGIWVYYQKEQYS
jgi:2-keto-3-deoxy-L-rhamnonate aldolase RhmA